jgi:hypothetical protein
LSNSDKKFLDNSFTYLATMTHSPKPVISSGAISNPFGRAQRGNLQKYFKAFVAASL